MSGYYPPNTHFPQYYGIDPNAVPNVNPVPSPMMPTDGSMPHGMPSGVPPYIQQFPSQHFQQPFLEQQKYEEPPDAAQGGNSARARRRQVPGEHVKHRRTRSGCYTCRGRRVKCDETHPVCERCRKGNRECVYPEPQSNTKSGRSGSKSSSKASPPEGTSSPEAEGDDSKDALPTIPDDDEDDDEELDDEPSALPAGQRDPSDTPSLIQDRSPSPSTEASSTTAIISPRPTLSRTSSNQAPRKASLTKTAPGVPPDVQLYLDYHRNHMSCHHYCLKRDANQGFKKAFLQIAMKHEPLLYAVVGYAAYFHTLSKPEGRISNFLQYYNKSVSLLRKSILEKRKHSLATLLTILQLASIEEMLGDWVNLMGHQRAAYEVLTKLYTPQTIMKNELQRKVLVWYTRFDLYVGLQSGGEFVLNREWFTNAHDWYTEQLKQDPDNLSLKYEARLAWTRLLASDAGNLFSRKAKGLLDNETFMAQLADVNDRMSTLESTLDPAMTDPNEYVTDFSGAPPRDPDDIVDPHEPNVIYKNQQWTTNYIMLDTFGIQFMYNIQVSMAMRKPLDPEMAQKAYRAIQIVEAMISLPHAPPGAIIEGQASWAIATLFLPKDAKTIHWCRRMFAKIESSGYIYPNTLRNRMLETWGLEHSDSWLPNDEGCPPIIRSIKNFIAERTTEPKDQTSEDLHEMRGIFSTLTISDSPSSDDRGLETPIEGSTGSAGVPASIDETLIYTGGSPDVGWGYEQDRIPGQERYGSGQFPGQ